MTLHDHALFDQSARKRPTNLSVNEDLLRRAKDSGLNLSAVLEKALAAELARTQQERWLEANQEAIASFNRRIEQSGAFSSGVRRF